VLGGIWGDGVLVFSKPHLGKRGSLGPSSISVCTVSKTKKKAGMTGKKGLKKGVRGPAGRGVRSEGKPGRKTTMFDNRGQWPHKGRGRHHKDTEGEENKTGKTGPLQLGGDLRRRHHKTRGTSASQTSKAPKESVRGSGAGRSGPDPY